MVQNAKCVHFNRYEELLARRLPPTEGAVNAHTDAVRIAKLRYEAGAIDLLSLLQHRRE
jgi:outer membrane protein TolC